MQPVKQCLWAISVVAAVFCWLFIWWCRHTPFGHIGNFVQLQIIFWIYCTCVSPQSVLCTATSFLHDSFYSVVCLSCFFVPSFTHSLVSFSAGASKLLSLMTASFSVNCQVPSQVSSCSPSVVAMSLMMNWCDCKLAFLCVCVCVHALCFSKTSTWAIQCIWMCYAWSVFCVS